MYNKHVFNDQIYLYSIENINFCLITITKYSKLIRFDLPYLISNIFKFVVSTQEQANPEETCPKIANA